MRHVDRPVRVCSRHILVPALLLYLIISSPAAAQVTIAGGYTWQRASTGARHEELRGHSIELVGRVAPRVGLLLAADRFGYASSLQRDGFSVTSVRAGAQFLLVREQPLDLGVSVGVGLHTLHVGREEDGPGSTVFAEVHLALHPVRTFGVFLSGITRSMSGFGQGLRGNSTGLTLGLQLRSPRW